MTSTGKALNLWPEDPLRQKKEECQTPSATMNQLSTNRNSLAVFGHRKHNLASPRVEKNAEHQTREPYHTISPHPPTLVSREGNSQDTKGWMIP
ncbi:hypothetical protein VTJ04DRAFT_4770 [Mycothermus thermophilus]|uniref:uncharacterized protein n=1 Tax=Humicola insolens TaxID=85995 RepID=UPI0037439B84